MQNLPKKVRSKKLNSRVDLTAMVSISFLLIIFFMVVGELSKQKAMNLSLPNYDCDDCGRGISCGSEIRTYTILLGNHNKLVCYKGLLAAPEVTPKEVSYGKNGIRKELFKENKITLNYSAQLGKHERGIAVIIKPSKKSNFKNLVDILDEMEITGIDTYIVVNEFSPEESKLIASN